MAFNDSFGIFGHFAFSSKPTHGRSIYESMIDGQGDSYNSDFTGLQSARLFAQAMCFASAQYQLDRALNNRNPAKATELLGKLEEDFQVTPGPRDTLPQRRAFLSALAQVSRGNSQGAIEGALSTLLGADFVSYTHNAASPIPASPGIFGTFCPTGTTIKQFVIESPISIVGIPVSFPYGRADKENDPLVGETYTVDPDPRRTTEQIKILAVDPVNEFATAIFTRAHEPLTVATRPYPLWISPRRSSVIRVSLAASIDPEKRRKTNEVMARASRGVSTWSIIQPTGVFTTDDTTLGMLDVNIMGTDAPLISMSWQPPATRPPQAPSNTARRLDISQPVGTLMPPKLSSVVSILTVEQSPTRSKQRGVTSPHYVVW